MNRRAALLATVLLGTAFTGCLGGEDPVTPTVVDGEGDTDLTNPYEGQQLAAFDETNMTVNSSIDGVHHGHDYWAGRSRVVIFEEPASMTPIGTSNVEGYVAEATFKPPPAVEGRDPVLIFEGTSVVEFTISEPERRYCEGEFTLGGQFVCTDNLAYHSGGEAPNLPRAPDPTGGPSGLKLRYKHSSTIEWVDVGELVWGTALPIKVLDPRDTDMPHATSSLWEFQVLSPNQYDSTLTFKAKAEIVRAEGAIPEWPGHPEFYPDGKHFRTVLEKAGATAADGGLTPGAEALAGETDGRIPADRLVSYGTRTLHVWVNVTEIQTPNPAFAPSHFFLFHSNATGEQNLTDSFTQYPLNTTSMYWALPVDDNGMDSPYADGSRWAFQLGAAMTAGLSCYSGCATWTAVYDIKVVASDIPLTYEQYHWNCLDDANCPPPPQDG